MTRTSRSTDLAAAGPPPGAPRSPDDGFEHVRWAGAVTVESYGATIGVRVTDATLLARIAGRMPTGSRASEATRVDELYSWVAAGDGPDGAGEHLLVAESPDEPAPREIARSTSVADVLAALRDSAEFGVALHAPALLFLHAAVVAWRGVAIAFPGRSFAGKTTITAALLRAGAQYYSDEYAVLDALGQLHPFPRRLRVRARDGRRSRWVSASRLGAPVGSGPVRLGLVVATSYTAGARWEPREMTAGETALALLDNAVVARARPAHAMARIAAAIETGTVGLRGPRGDADATAALVLERASRMAGAR